MTASPSSPPPLWEQLLPLEEALFSNGLAPTTTLSWLEAPVDIAQLRARAAEIVFNNPWLVGKLQKRDGKWGIEYSPFDSVEDAKRDAIEKAVFRTFGPGQVDVHPDLPWTAQCKICQDHATVLLQPKQELKGDTFWKISAIPTSDEKYVGLAVSLSHTIGDGHTFYKLYGALLGDAIPALTVTRQQETTRQQEEHFGKDESKVMASLGVIGTAIRGLLGKLVLGYWRPQHWTTVAKVYRIDPQKIAHLKTAASEQGTADGDDDVPFVSTNDIISSWMLKNCPNGIVAMNMRGRLDGHNDDMAGNYENCLYLRQADCATPALIRRAVSTGKRAITVDDPYSNWELSSGSLLGVVTNWASFYPANLDPVHKTHYHGPIANLGEQVPPTIAACLIFNSGVAVAGEDSRTKRLSVLIAASPDFHSRLDTASITVAEEEEVKE